METKPSICSFSLNELFGHQLIRTCMWCTACRPPFTMDHTGSQQAKHYCEDALQSSQEKSKTIGRIFTEF